MDANLEMAFRHVREAEQHVARQKAIIAELRRDGHSTKQAEDILEIFKSTLATHRESLRRRLQEQSRAEPPEKSGD